MSIKSFCKPEVIAVVGGLVAVDLAMIGYTHVQVANVAKLAKSLNDSAKVMEETTTKIFENVSSKETETN